MKARLLMAGCWVAMLPLAVAPAARAQSSNVQVWTSATSGLTYKLKMDERHIEAEKVFPPEFQSQVEQGAYVRCEYSQKEGAWKGKCSAHLPLSGDYDEPKWCTFKFRSEITSLTPTRIEGESEVWANQDVDAAKCAIKKSRMQHFVWILKRSPAVPVASPASAPQKAPRISSD